MKTRQYEYEDMVYWCPEQVLNILKGEPLEPVQTLFAHGPTLWFVVYTDGTGGLISGIEWYAMMYRALMNSVINDVNIKPDPKPEHFPLIKAAMAKEGVTDEMVKNFQKP